MARQTTIDTSTAGAGTGPPSMQDGGAALFEWLRTMRDHTPVWRDGRGGYHVFRSADVHRVMSDFEVFSSDRTAMMPNSDLLARGNLTMMDPPQHRKLRGLVSQAFTPKTIAGLAPRITETASRLLDEVSGDEFDFMASLAYPLPVIVIAELLGVPPSDRERFRTWAAGFGEAMESAVVEMNDYMLQKCAERRRAPEGDLISRLAGLETDGELSDDAIAELCSLLLLAGYITTTMMLGNLVLSLDENPAADAEVRRDPALVPAAIEETLRFRSPFMQVGRVTTRETTLGSETIPRGAYVTAWLISANHDERQFSDPETFDLHREVGRQIAFGHGIHFCLGTPLARLEGQIALRLLHERFAEIRVTPGADVPFIDGAIFGAIRLPVSVRRNG